MPASAPTSSTRCRSSSTSRAATSSRCSTTSSTPIAPRSPDSTTGVRRRSTSTLSDMATGTSGSPSATLQVEPLAGPAMLDRPGPTGGPAKTGGIWLVIVRRILQGLLVLVLVSIVVFAATQALPGDPARAILGRGATPASLAALREQLHLNRPVVEQYVPWAVGLIHGDAGRSFAAQEPVSKLLGDRIINTAFLLLCSGLISIPLSILIGSYAALWRDRPFDVATSLITLVFAALPEFVVGVALVVLFSTTVFHILPAITLIPPGGRPWEQPVAIILPTLTLVLAVPAFAIIGPRISPHGGKDFVGTPNRLKGRRAGCE